MSDENNTYHVTMEVSVTVEVPAEVTVSNEEIISLAMTSITLSHKVACGRITRPNSSMLAWADVYAEVFEEDCVLIGQECD